MTTFQTFDEYVKSYTPTFHSSRVYPDWSISTDHIDFGNVNIGSTLTKTLIIENVGTATLKISDIVISGPFTLSGNTVPSMVPGTSTNLSIGFSPTDEGSVTGSITFSIDGNPYVINLTGSGVAVPVTGWDHTEDISNMLTGLWAFIQRAVQPALTELQPSMNVTPSSVVFSSPVVVGSESNVVTITIQNSGSKDLVIDSMTVTGDFEVS